MAYYFTRWVMNDARVPVHRLPQQITEVARNLPERRQNRYLATRMLLAETMLRLYGFSVLPELIMTVNGRPCFANPQLPDFSIACAGNIVGVLMAEEGGSAGLDMEMVRAHSRQTLEQYSREISSAEKAWIHAQADPDEAATQLWTIRQSVLKLTGEEKTSLRLHPASGRLRSLRLPDIETISDIEPLLIWSCAMSSGSERLSVWEFDGNGWKTLQDIPLPARNMGPRSLRMYSLPSEN